MVDTKKTSWSGGTEQMEKWRGLEMQMYSCASEINVVSKT